MDGLIPFFIVLFAALIFPLFLRGFHVPWVVALISGGMLIGPFGLDFVSEGEVLSFLGQIGLVFLMFMAGLETGLSNLKKSEKESLTIAVFNGIIPFAVGVSIALYFGYGFEAAFIVGMVFTSSSIVAALPSLERNGLIDTRVGTTVIGSTIIQDIFSLLMLGAFLQYVDPASTLPLPIFITLLLGSLICLKLLLPKLAWILRLEEKNERGFEDELRVIIVTLIGVVVFYEIIGLHSIVAGFLAGLFLSDVITHKDILNKIHALGYGLFIPIFFILIGIRTDLSVFSGASSGLWLTTAVILGSIGSKYFSGWITGRIEGFNSAESSIIGSTSIPQLSTTLAVVFVGLDLGIIDHQLSTALIGLSIVTTMTGPTLIDTTLRYLPDEHPLQQETDENLEESE